VQPINRGSSRVVLGGSRTPPISQQLGNQVIALERFADHFAGPIPGNQQDTMGKFR
jgi:hypothetical protein